MRGMVDVVRRRRGPAAVPAAAARRGVAVRRDRRRVRRRGPAPRRQADAADAGCLDAQVVTGARGGGPVAHPRGRRGPRRPHPGCAPAWPGWEDAAVPPERLGAYLREFSALMREHGLDGLHLRALRRRLRPRPHRLPAAPPRRACVPRSSPSDAAQLVAAARRLDVRRARRRPGAQRAARLHVLTRAPLAAFAAVKRIFDPGNAAQPGRLARPRRRSTPTCGSPPPARCRAGLGFAYSARRRRLRHRRAPLCRGGQVPGRHHRDAAASCARPTWPPGTRRTPPAAAPACCRSWPTARWSPAGARRRSPSRSTCAWPARAARRTARRAWTWPPTRPKSLYQRYRRQAPSGRAHYALGWLPRWAGWPSHAPGWPTHALRHIGPWPAAAQAARPAWTPAARCRASPRYLPPHSVRAAVPRASAGQARPVVLWVDTFTDAFHARGAARPRVRVLEAAGYPVSITARPRAAG